MLEREQLVGEMHELWVGRGLAIQQQGTHVARRAPAQRGRGDDDLVDRRVP